MRTVVFVMPFPAEASLRFAQGFSELPGVRLVGCVQRAPGRAARGIFSDVVKVTDAFDGGQLIAACEKVRKAYGGIHRIVSVLEPVQVAVSEARAYFHLPGPDPKTSELFRDKGKMKDALRRAGLPCARHQVVKSLAEAVAFERTVGFPLVLKPLAGVGCKATWRVNSFEELKAALAAVGTHPGEPTLAEEFLKGREYNCDSLIIDGVPRFVNVGRYSPGPLEVKESPWIQWTVVFPRSIHPEFDDVLALNTKAIAALGLGTGFTHMEWFRREDGTVAIGEIAARPPGANFVDMMNFGHDADLYRGWARALIDGEFDGPLERKYAVGCAYLRGIGSGRVRRVRGIQEANEAVGKYVVRSRLPRAGQPKSDSYEGDGFVILRDPNTEVVQKAVATIIQTIRVEYA